MAECAITSSQASQEWPEGVVSVRQTMNPYLLAMAMEEAYRQGMKPWELINMALWEKLGKPDHETLMKFAADLEVDDEAPKWLKRLRMAARHELQVAAVKAAAAKETDEAEENRSSEGNGEGHPGTAKE